MKRISLVIYALGLAATGSSASASMITLGGVITQSPADAGATPVSNPTLNGMVDGQSYTDVLNFTGPLAGPGTYAITSASFMDAAAGASEAGFIPVGSSFTVTLSGPNALFSALVCLADCAVGNQLALQFSIPAAQLTGTGVAASAVSPFLPEDLLEDGGNTDIHGSVTSYSYTVASASTPEPASIGLMLAGLAFLGAAAAKIVPQPRDDDRWCPPVNE